MSAPEQKWPPAPVMTTTRTAGSASAARRAWGSWRRSSNERALRTSTRSRVSVRTPPSSLMRSPFTSTASGRGTGRAGRGGRRRAARPGSRARARRGTRPGRCGGPRAGAGGCCRRGRRRRPRRRTRWPRPRRVRGARPSDQEAQGRERPVVVDEHDLLAGHPPGAVDEAQPVLAAAGPDGGATLAGFVDDEVGADHDVAGFGVGRVAVEQLDVAEQAPQARPGGLGVALVVLQLADAEREPGAVVE